MKTQVYFELILLLILMRYSKPENSFKTRISKEFIF